MGSWGTSASGFHSCCTLICASGASPSQKIKAFATNALLTCGTAIINSLQLIYRVDMEGLDAGVEALEAWRSLERVLIAPGGQMF